MTGQITIDELKLTGFRAYLEPQTFKLHSRKNGPLSLAVFAPNGKGKSSMVDALEYYFCKDGSLKRLGLKSTANKAGKGAIRHVCADMRGMKTSVAVQFRQGKDRFGGPRPFSDSLTDSAKRVLKHAKVPFVIRGHELRRFVEDTSPMAWYDDLAAWLDLMPLLEVQKRMWDLKRRVKKEVADQREDSIRIRDLENITDDTIHTWDERAILEWLNESILAPLDASIKFKTLSYTDTAWQELESQKRAELERAGLGIQEKLLDTIEALLGRQATLQGDPTGKIHSFERSVSVFKDATDKEFTARSATSKSVFREVWESAKRLLGDDSELDICPVCDTEFAKSPSGSRDGVYTAISLNLNGLKEYRKVEAAKKRAEKDLVQVARGLGGSLDWLLFSVDSRYEYDEVATYSKNLKSWKVGEGAPDSGAVTLTLASLHASVSAEIERIGRQRDDITYNSAYEKVRRLLYTKSEWDRVRRIKDEMRTISDRLDRQVKTYDTSIVRYVRGLVDKLVDEAGAIYKEIQGPDVNDPHIQIKLAREGDAVQHSAKLLIDFEGLKSVAPSGYLSDSQVHTLALSIRLAAICRFNAEVGIIALDDIVTSYDADHRKNIATVLNDRFGKFQIILATHDMQFFDILRDHLDEKRWKFKRIKQLQAGVGPIFSDHHIIDKEIEAKIEAGEDAAHDIRYAAEKWLSCICYDFATPVEFRRNWHPSMGEMARSLDKFLKERKLGSPAIPGYSKPFLLSLRWAKIENMGSHYRNTPYASLSDGDTKARWEELKIFRNMFKCQECGCSRFKRPPDWKKPACMHCETPFKFGRETPV